MTEHQNGPKSIVDKIERTLDFYAKPENWKQSIDGCGNVNVGPATRDGGQMARDTLKEWTGKK